MRFLLPLILLSTFSNNAFATHAYRSEHCTSATHALNYNGNYPVGGMYGIKKAEQDNQDELTALPLFDTETPTTLDDAEVVFNELASNIIKTGPSSNDCGFDHEEWTSEKTVEISLISKEASAQLGLKQGDKMTMICEESSDFPNGTDCE